MFVKVTIMNDSNCPTGFSELDPKPSDREQISKLVFKTAKFPCSFSIRLPLSIFFFCNHEAILLLVDPP